MIRSRYVRRGGSDGLTVVAPDHPIWVRFARAMAAFAAPGAKRVGAFVSALPEPPRTVLDVAAGHGLYGIEVAKAVRTAVVTAVDWAGVLAIAKENAQVPGWEYDFARLREMHWTLNGESGFDLVLLPNILHYFDRDRCVALLRKVKSQCLANWTDIGRRVCSQSRSRVPAASGHICLFDARDVPER